MEGWLGSLWFVFNENSVLRSFFKHATSSRTHIDCLCQTENSRRRAAPESSGIEDLFCTPPPPTPLPRTHSLSLHKHIHPAGFTVLLVVEVEAGMRKHADVPWKYLSGPSNPPNAPKHSSRRWENRDGTTARLRLLTHNHTITQSQQLKGRYTAYEVIYLNK